MLDLAQSSTNFVLPFKDGGRYYLFDGSSTAIAEVRRDLFHVVERAKRIGLSRALDDVQSDGGEDASAGLRATFEQLRAKRFFGAPASARVQQLDGDAPLMEAYLSLVDGCNLRCRYCFVPSQQAAKNRYMSVETATRAMDFLVARADRQHGLSIVLWGGEPLLNLTLVRTVLERGTKLSAETGIPIRFATTTNCTLLTPEASELLIRHRVIVNMSIDGDAASHDLHRIFPGGRGTADIVAKRVRAFIALARQEWPAFVPRARLTLTRPTVSRLAENCRSVWGLGIPIVWMKDVDWQANDGAMNLRPADYVAIREQFAILREQYRTQLDAGRAADVLPQLWFDLHEIHQRARRITGCGGGNTGVSVATDGTITACYHLATSGDSYTLGHVGTGEFDEEKRATFRRRQVDGVHGCASCEFKYLCGGGCFAKSIFHNRALDECWEGQCAFIWEYKLHCLRLYVSLMHSPYRDRLRELLAQTESRPAMPTACQPEGRAS